METLTLMTAGACTLLAVWLWLSVFRYIRLVERKLEMVAGQLENIRMRMGVQNVVEGEIALSCYRTEIRMLEAIREKLLREEKYEEVSELDKCVREIRLVIERNRRNMKKDK